MEIGDLCKIENDNSVYKVIDVQEIKEVIIGEEINEFNYQRFLTLENLENNNRIENIPIFKAHKIKNND